MSEVSNRNDPESGVVDNGNGSDPINSDGDPVTHAFTQSFDYHHYRLFSQPDLERARQRRLSDRGGDPAPPRSRLPEKPVQLRHHILQNDKSPRK